jgi:dephospho-CoA kinase
MPKRIVILTGGIGSGKSAAADLFRDLGVPIVDADEISHALTAPGGAAMPAIAAAFGDQVVNAEGGLDRAAMRAVVFENPAQRERLEGILHPMIQKMAKDQLAQASGPYAIYVVPLWAESAAKGTMAITPDHVIVVDCSPQTQISRVMQRNQLTQTQVQAVLNSQALREDRLKLADLVIHNDQDFAHLQAQVRALHQQLNQP